jgi:hypothetical protein
MDATRDRIEGWGSRPVGDREALRRLAADGFTGAVVDGDAVLFLLNGRAVGSVGREVDGFDGGTAREAPDPSLPLLFAMQASDGETQTRGYTKDTPLREVDETLQSSNFTGYVDLSENVLSGEYYLLYYGGQPLYVAFVGPDAERVVGEAALDRAADEVGIYEVIDVALDVRDIPAPEGDAGDAADEERPSGAAGATAEGAAAAPDESAESTAGASATADAADSEGAAAASPESGSESETASTPEPGAEPGPSPDSGAGESADDAEAGPDPDAGSADDREPAGTEEETEPPAAGSDATPPDRKRDDATVASAGDATGEDAGTEANEDGVFAEEEEWRKTTSIPALSPDETDTVGPGPDPERQSEPTDGERRDRSGSARSSDGASRTADLREELESRARQLESARERIESLTADLESEREARERLEAELSELRDERETLRERVEALEEELAAARASAATDQPGEEADAPDRQSMAPERALAETNLFVRYESRSEPTLGDVAVGADREAATANLRLEHHTQFDADGVAVDGEPFEVFLRSTPEYRFVRWAVAELPFEIRETGREEALADLYGVLPDVDRAELHASIEVEPASSSEADRHEFDVVLRDRMGAPLVVADINDRRDPVSGEMMDDFVDAAAAVEVTSGGEVGGALYVTESFFAPDALEAAEAAVGGGFLSRSNKENYVHTDRKRGFHLCLIESRDDSFYATVPEL